jgi:hypothetical protein
MKQARQGVIGRVDELDSGSFRTSVRCGPIDRLSGGRRRTTRGKIRPRARTGRPGRMVGQGRRPPSRHVFGREVARVDQSVRIIKL